MRDIRAVLGRAIVAAMLLAPAFAGEPVGRAKVGEIALTPLATDHPYAAAQTLEYVVQHPGATYIKVHFSRFDLAPGDRLVIASADGNESYTFTGKGHKDRGVDFWANSVLGDTAVLTLHSVGDGGYGFDIDYYAYGIVPLFPPQAEAGLESVCGEQQWTDVACNIETYPTEVDRASRAVVVLYKGTEHCTGVKVGCPNQFLTNEHCLTSQNEVDDAEVRFDFQLSSCNGAISTSSESYLGDQFLADDRTLDYCLFTAVGASDSYLAAELDDRLPPVGERLYISGHPHGGPKQLSIEDDQSPTGLCRADFSPIYGNATATDIAYYCDTTNGSSGSPVWSGVTHKVVALHHFGGCPNYGVRSDLILSQISSLLAPCVTSTCGDGVAEADEECDGADLNGATCSGIGCASGSVACRDDCTLDYGGCDGCPPCDRDGVCDAGENCNTCAADCPKLDTDPVCGNLVCEPFAGEDCLSCPTDCNGKQKGKLDRRFCCGDGDGQYPVGCNDSRCSANGNECLAVRPDACCGDGVCEHPESGVDCAIDCGPCGDGVCDPGVGENSCVCTADCGTPPAAEWTCTDGVDNDCDNNADCNDSDCNGDPACPTCTPSGESCSADFNCCSRLCKGSGVCK